jgi:1-acyl-sn-glycerol-3-phosphate acyltransferase
MLLAMPNQIETASLTSPSAASALKTVWGAIATIACVLVTAVLVIPAAILGRAGWLRMVTQVSTFWARALIFMCGVKVEIQGLENLRGVDHYVLVCNHQSFFDIFAVAAYMPGQIRFVAKRELLKIPVFGYSLKVSGHVIIDRQAGGREIRKAIDIARQGFTLCIFAEGHRYNDNRIHEFEEGAAWLAALTKLPAVPMAISGSGSFFPRGARVVVPGGKMRMTIGKPIAVEELKGANRKAVTSKLEEAVRAMFVEEV